MTGSISSLSNMEMQLYGGLAGSTGAPSYVNNYMGANQMGTAYPSAYNLGGYNSTFGQTLPSNYTMGAQNNRLTQTAQTTQTAQAGQGQTSIFQGLTQTESKAMVDYYAKGLTPTQTLLGAAGGQAAFSIIMHPRLLAHPFNSAKTIGGVEKMFSSIKDPNSVLGKLWQNPDTNELLREAYFQTHKAKARLESKLGLFRSSYSRQVDGKFVNKDAVEKLLKEMESALAAGDKTKIAEATAKLQAGYVNDGAFYRAKQSVKNFFTGKKESVMTVEEAIKANSESINKTVKKLTADNPTTFMERMKAPGTVKNALLFAGMNMLFSIGKIKKAFAKDKENEQNGISSNNGIKQVGQTVVKGIGGAVGWTIGEAAGAAAFAKWGAKIGTTFGPGVGTVVGALAGLVCGSVGMTVVDKLSNLVFGKDVADKIEAENLAKTNEGQAQILQYTVQQAQSGKPLPVDVQQATQKIIAQYA